MNNFYSETGFWGLPLRVLSESSFANLVMKHFAKGFIIISAQKDEYSDEQNHSRYDELRHDVREAGFGFIPVIGAYQTSEQKEPQREYSLFVPAKSARSSEPINFQSLFDLGKQLCSKYNQESFLAKPPDGNASYVDRNGNSIKDFSKTTLNNSSEELFTHLLGRPDRRFTLKELYVPVGARSFTDFVFRTGDGEITVSNIE